MTGVRNFIYGNENKFESYKDKKHWEGHQSLLKKLVKVKILLRSSWPLSYFLFILIYLEISGNNRVISELSIETITNAFLTSFLGVPLAIFIFFFLTIIFILLDLSQGKPLQSWDNKIAQDIISIVPPFILTIIFVLLVHLGAFLYIDYFVAQMDLRLEREFTQMDSESNKKDI